MTSKELVNELITDFKAFIATPEFTFDTLATNSEIKIEKFRVEHVQGMKEKCATIVEGRAACAAEIRVLPV